MKVQWQVTYTQQPINFTSSGLTVLSNFSAGFGANEQVIKLGINYKFL